MRASAVFLCGVLAAGVMTSKVIAAPALEDESDVKAWAEIEVALPPYPKESDLLSFRVGAVRDIQFLIDTKSLSIGQDGVIRYALVIVSSSGARNVSFEGLRCETREGRNYAFGRGDGTWAKARSNQWQPIRGGSNNPHVELHASYFCADGTPLFTVDEILRRMRELSKVQYGK